MQNSLSDNWVLRLQNELNTQGFGFLDVDGKWLISRGDSWD